MVRVCVAVSGIVWAALGVVVSVAVCVAVCVAAWIRFIHVKDIDESFHTYE